ncbi:RDD family protein [Thalassovita sp.]|uniref:RDD family protein n=1 Tax=Thalassovita sp. TaxID=1979401 RepID=UPI0029DE8274|nr:RDD family protein [Thalassovita sp.]
MQDWSLPDPHVQPEFYADVPMKRLIAFALDMLAIVLICIVILPFTAFTGLFFFPFLMAVVGFVYRVVSIASGSATPGMRLMAIEFRAADGRRFDLGLAFLHTLGFYASFAVFPAQLLSVILMATSERGQGLSDQVLGSVAINRPARH